MSNEYEFLFNNFINPLRNLNFNENFGEDTRLIKHQFNCKSNVTTARPSGKVLDYSIEIRDYFSNKKVLLINYHSNSISFQPEQVRFFEPTWLDFTDKQLSDAIKYLTPILNMKMETNRNHYRMLIFKDKFHISIRVKNLFDELEHVLCITAYDYSLGEGKKL